MNDTLKQHSDDPRVKAGFRVNIHLSIKTGTQKVHRMLIDPTQYDQVSTGVKILDRAVRR